MESEDCKCNGDNTKYLDLILYDCENKIEGKTYVKDNETGACLDLCQKSPRNKICPKEEMNPDLLNILRIIHYLSSNINIYNQFIENLITEENKENYKNEIDKLDKDVVCAVGKAKILVQEGTINNELANIMNIFGAVLHSITKQNKDLIEISEETFIETLEALADLGCSAGKLNLFFQEIERKYNFDEIEEFEELERLITIDEFKFILNNNVNYLIDTFDNYNFLSIEYNDGDEIGGDGGGNYNPKYHFFYILKFLKTNKNLKMININIKDKFELDEKLMEKYEEINSKAVNYSYLIKYLKYKTKYLKLKKLLNKK